MTPSIIRGRWSVGRAVAFGCVSSSIGSVGHARVTGMSVDAASLAVMAVILGIAALSFGRRRRGIGSIALLLLGSQPLVHTACILFGALRPPDAAMHAMGHGAGASPALASMALVHVLALLAGVGVLAGLERLAWRGVRAASSILRRAGAAPEIQLPDVRPGALARAARWAADGLHPHLRWTVAATPRRGPPALA